MKNAQFVSIQDVSVLCHIEIDALREWAEDGLIAVRSEGKTEGVAADALRDIRRIVDLYKVLGVNKEGIEIILAMRDQILEMGRSLSALQQKLDRLENDQRLRYLEIPREMGLIVDYYETRE